jgi:transcriptional regulator with XRE-family HTH domain
MAEFDRDKVEDFLGVVRKYMQVRGGLSQKELAEKADVGVSTMSRFLTQKTSELNPQFIAKIVAVLEIPLHEIIDFVEEDFTEHFVKLVRFYKELSQDEQGEDPPEEERGSIPRRRTDDFSDDLASSLGTATQKARARVNIGGRSRNIPFEPDDGSRNSGPSLREKLEGLTPRQKAYMTEFLNLDMEGRDLVVDIGNNLFRYFKQKGMDF